MKLKYETPYIMELELMDNRHLIVSYSDGIKKDIGYLPADGITIQYRRGNNERHDKAPSSIAEQVKNP